VPEYAKQSANVKVVHLEPEGQRMTRARIARLPAAVHAVHEKGKQLLLDKLRAFFDQADDSLFSLADKASSNQEQNIYFDSMREVRVQRRGFEKRFNSSIDTAFANLVSADAAPTVSDDTLSADTLSLVQNEQLEEMVAIESSVNRANNEYGEAIQHLSLRLDSLVPVKVFQKNNPLGPDVVSVAFMDQTKRLDIDIKAKLVLFKLFDRAVMQGLGSLYVSANQILIEHNILPSLVRAGAPSGRSGGVNPHGNHMSASVPHSSSPVGGSEVEGSQASTEVMQLLQGLLAEKQSLQSAQPTDVIRLLSLAQHSPVPVNNVRGGVKALELINELQRRSGSASTVEGTDREVINLVDMLFNFILEDRNLAEEMKEQISLLQIPIVKVALLDKSFFAKGGHAARRLLNEMATAALGWQPNENGKGDPLYRKIKELVSTLLTEFETDVSIFNDMLADFSSFVAKDKKRAELLERRALDAEDGKAKAEVARSVVAIEIELRTVDQVLPEIVEKLIEGPWSNVLFLNNLKQGIEAKGWVDALQTLEDLVWSSQPPQSNEDRKRLIRMVPDLLQRLRMGLDSISFNPFEMSEIFKELENVHLACIRGEIPAGVDAANASVTKESSVDKARRMPSIEELEAEVFGDAEEMFADVDAAMTSADLDDLEPVEIKRRMAAASASKAKASAAKTQKKQERAIAAKKDTLPENDPFMQQVANFVQGAWFEMSDDNDNSSRCRLAAIIKPTGKYIFINRGGMKVAEKAQTELALMLKQNRIRALDNSMLFDRALETVVTSLRKPQ